MIPHRRFRRFAQRQLHSSSRRRGRAGLNAEDVTILDSTGTLLASGDDPSNSSANRSIGVELTVENQIVDNIHRALAPYLGADNFRASVKADVNTDTRQTEETIFDSASRVERSVQVVKSNDSATQQSPADPATVEQNLPQQGRRIRARRAVAGEPRAPRGDDELRAQLEEDRHGEQRLHARPAFDLGGRQPRPHCRRHRRERHA